MARARVARGGVTGMAGDGATILLVDDEKVFATNMARLLSNRGYVVRTANCGNDAVRALANDVYDVVVLDLHMPEMGGFAVLKEMQKMGALSSTIILTGYASMESAKEAIRLGVYDYLLKPCEVDELVEKIEDVRGKDS